MHPELSQQQQQLQKQQQQRPQKQPGNQKVQQKQGNGAKHKGEPLKFIKIEAKSSKEVVYVAIDGQKVFENVVTDDNGRGIHVVVLNQNTGVVMATRRFDTYYTGEDQLLISFCNLVQEGRIVIFMIKDEGAQQLRKPCRNVLKMFGSKHVFNLGYRDMWALISKKKNTWFAEAHHKAPKLFDWGSPLEIQATVPLDSKSSACKWGDDATSERRRQFCNKYEGYGDVCRCTNPAPIDLRGPPLPGSRVNHLPIAIIAANRPHYLYRMIRGLLQVPGVEPSMVTVYIDGFYDEPVAVAELFKLSAVEHVPMCSKNCRISQHYRRTLSETFTKYPQADYMIILEEDLDVSIDIMDYFSQILPLLEQDESLYCVSAWNDQGYEHSCKDPKMLYRVETMPGLGWVLKRKLFKVELEPNWPGKDKYWDWDIWMRGDGNRKGRECIIPDVSRTYHFGAKGLNVNVFFQEAYFLKHTLNTQIGIRFDVDKMTKDGYEVEVNKIIKGATLLDHKKNPCSHTDFVPERPGSTFIMYIQQKRIGDWDTWMNIARCFKLWDLDVRGFHKGMWRFWIKESHIIVIGYPFSAYSHYRPNGLEPIFIPKKKEKKKE